VLLNFADGEITVSDCGIGIPPESVDKVFDRFYRVDESRTRDSGGSGLGLSICRAIVEAHGGTVDLTSEVGKGTTVRVSLPA
jgi:signal transduction histidine kinase